jgi:hypothetical protein
MLPIDAPPQLPSAPVEISVTAEQVHVGGGVHMGMLGLDYRRLFTPQWSAGLSAYGAATGDRGGFFAWGAHGTYRQTWGPWQAETGLFAGGGGGSPAWVGGGLMLRPHVELSRAVGAWRLGVGASRVKFPNGQVDSSQPYVSLRWSADRYLGPGGGAPSLAWDAAGSARAADSELAGVLGVYRPTRPPGRGETGKQGSLQYGGLAYRRSLDTGPVLGATPYVGLTTLGAVGGGYDGYAELTGAMGLQWRAAMWPSLALRIEAALGAGGAGATVDTGGGGLAKASGALVWQATPNVSMSAVLGHVRSLGRFDANEARLELAWRFRDILPAGAGGGRRTEGPAPAELAWTPWSVCAGWSRYASTLRDDGSSSPMGMIALRLERRFGPHWRLVTQASTAATGQAGGYAAGQIGAGWMSQRLAGSPLQWGLEASVGAAGGGSVRVDGGRIGQAQLQARYALSPDWAVQIDVGRLRSLRGDLSTPLLGVSLVSLFSMLEGH